MKTPRKVARREGMSHYIKTYTVLPVDGNIIVLSRQQITKSSDQINEREAMS
jgi:hypothetical protein